MLPRPQHSMHSMVQHAVNHEFVTDIYSMCGGIL